MGIQGLTDGNMRIQGRTDRRTYADTSTDGDMRIQGGTDRKSYADTRTNRR